jgi:hypothetical protein
MGGIHVSRRLALFVAALLLTAALPIGTVSASSPTRVQFRSTGASVSFSEVRDGLQVVTELSADNQASRDGVTTPFMFINQNAYAPDATGEYNVLAWYVEGNTTDFAMTIDGQLGSASVSAPAVAINRCDGEFNCVESTAPVGASFTATGTAQRSHQSSVGSISGLSMFIYHDVGSYRFATATVTIDGTTFGPSSGPAEANIYDTRTGWIDITRSTSGARAVAAGVTVYDTTAPATGRQTGDSMFADWTSQSGGIGRNTVLFASTRRVNAQGTFQDIRSIGYADQVYAVDEFGNTTPISDTQGSFDASTASTISLDKSLSTGILGGAVIPATSCTYIGDEVFCIDTVVHADARWTGYGTTTKTRDGSSSGVAGVILIVYHNTSSHRSATATATIDGTALDAADVVEGWVDRTTTGFHEVHIGS